MYTNYGKQFCREFGGDWYTWPSWANTVCPKCRQEFAIADKIIVAKGTVWHYDCYPRNKPPFRWYEVP